MSKAAEYMSAYYKTENGRARVLAAMKRYSRTEKYKARLRSDRQTEKRRAAARRRQRARAGSPILIAAKRRYLNSEKGAQMQARAYCKRHGIAGPEAAQLIELLAAALMLKRKLGLAHGRRPEDR